MTDEEVATGEVACSMRLIDRALASLELEIQQSGYVAKSEHTTRPSGYNDVASLSVLYARIHLMSARLNDMVLVGSLEMYSQYR